MVTDVAPQLWTSQRHLCQRSPLGTIVIVMMVLLGAFFVFGGDAYGSSSSRPPTVRVQPGDSLWGIATKYYDGTDVRDVVAQIISTNHLVGGSVYPGEALTLPPG